MMTRTQAFNYAVGKFYVDEMPKKEFRKLMKALMETPHKPWCRTRLRDVFPNYGSDCTCDEG